MSSSENPCKNQFWGELEKMPETTWSGPLWSNRDFCFTHLVTFFMSPFLIQLGFYSLTGGNHLLETID
jgi:hypothetical protein